MTIASLLSERTPRTSTSDRNHSKPVRPTDFITVRTFVGPKDCLKAVYRAHVVSSEKNVEDVRGSSCRPIVGWALRSFKS